MDNFYREQVLKNGDADFKKIIEKYGEDFFDEFLYHGFDYSFDYGWWEGYDDRNDGSEEQFVDEYMDFYQDDAIYKSLSKDEFVEIAKLSRAYFYDVGYYQGRMDC
jgi:hypothetical protein